MRRALLVAMVTVGCGGSTASFDDPGLDPALDDAAPSEVGADPDAAAPVDAADAPVDAADAPAPDDGSSAATETDAPTNDDAAPDAAEPDAAEPDAASDAPTPPPTGYRLPLACGGPYTITQGNFDTACTLYSHSDKAAYAYDFGVGLNTPVLAMRAGEVILVKNDIKPPHPCYWGGNAWCAQHVNYVVLKHDDGYATLYMHLNDATVPLGKKVAQGEVIGLSGATGWSTGPHMHVQRQEICGSHWCQSVPLLFDESATRLDCGMKIASMNACP